MKKVLVCALAALFLMATCLTAFAVPTYTTTTSYGTDGSLTVATNVTTAEDGEMITYLAYNGTGDSPATDDDIIYIDQQTWAGETLTFSYTTTADKLTGVTVKSGSSELETAQTMDLGARTVTVEVKGGDTVAATTITLPSASVGNYVTDITVANAISAVTVNGSDATPADVATVNGYNKIVIVDNGLADDAVIVITTVVPDTFEPAVAEGVSKGKAFVTTEEEVEVEKLTVFGEVKTDVAEPTGDWGGILITKTAATATDDNFKVGGTDVTPYAAKARAGEANVYTFAVQLVNKGAKELTTAPLWARVYSKDANDDYAYGEIIAFNEVVAN